METRNESALLYKITRYSSQGNPISSRTGRFLHKFGDSVTQRLERREPRNNDDAINDCESSFDKSRLNDGMIRCRRRTDESFDSHETSQDMFDRSSYKTKEKATTFIFFFFDQNLELLYH